MFKVFARDWWCRSQKVDSMDIHADLAVCLPICSAINSIMPSGLEPNPDPLDSDFFL